MYLREVSKGEDITVYDEELRRYVREAAGDVRQAINLLQGGQQASQLGELGERGRYKDVDRSVSEALNGFFAAASKDEALASLRALSMSPFEKVREIHRSIIKSGLPPSELAKALETVSAADVLIGKMMRSGDWRLLRYLDRLFAEDLHPVVKGNAVRYSGQDDLPFPVLSRIWNDSKKITEISLRYASRARTSGMSARSQDLPYVFSLCSRKGFRGSWSTRSASTSTRTFWSPTTGSSKRRPRGSGGEEEGGHGRLVRPSASRDGRLRDAH